MQLNFKSLYGFSYIAEKHSSMSYTHVLVYYTCNAHRYIHSSYTLSLTIDCDQSPTQNTGLPWSHPWWHAPTITACVSWWQGQQYKQGIVLH